MGKAAATRGVETSHDYRTEIPNTVDDMGLSPHAYRLYGHVKRRAGDSGVCYEGTSGLAHNCNMSVGAVSKAKKELKGHGLVRVKEGDRKKGEADEITVVDIWAQNTAAYAPEEVPTPLHIVKGPPSYSEDPPSHYETKKNHPVSQERPPDGGPKKQTASLPTPAAKKVGKLEDDEAEHLFGELCETDPNGPALRDLARLLAAENATGKVAITKVWRVLGERYVRTKKRQTLSDAAWSYGFDEAVSREKPSIGYVLKCAKGYRPEKAGSSLAARSNRGRDSIAVVGATEEDYDLSEYNWND